MVDKLKEFTYEGSLIEGDWHITWRATRTESGHSILRLQYATGRAQRNLFGLALPINLASPLHEDTIRHALKSVSDDLSMIIFNWILKDAEKICTRLDRVMKVAQWELDLKDIVWMRSDRIFHAGRTGTVQRLYPSGRVHIILDPNPRYPHDKPTSRIVGIRGLVRHID